MATEAGRTDLRIGLAGRAGRARPAPRVGGRIRTALARLGLVRTAVLGAAWVGLMVVWAATCVRLGLTRSWSYGALAGADLALLVILYLAEGMELAVTDLLDKDPEQVANPAVRALLEDIQASSGFFYANRQVFVVAVIAFMSLTTAYPWIAVPGLGLVSSTGARFWFSFTLTTLTVLWFAQVLPKRLAIVKSELFLSQCRPIWQLIRLVGMLGLPTPTDAMVALICRWTSYGEHRLLLPSRAVLYSIQTRLYGYALDRLSTSVLVGKTGAATIRKRFLVLFLHGPHWETYGSIETPRRLRRRPRVTVLGVYRAAVPEQLEAIARDLDAVFAGEPGVGSRLVPIPLTDWHHEATTVRAEPVQGTHRAYWIIRGQCLPESYQDPTEPAPGTPAAMIALLYDVEAEIGRGVDEPSWSETTEVPCRTLTIEVAPRAGSRVAIAAGAVSATLSPSRAERADESRRLTRQFLANRGAVTIEYPLLGATYALHWSTLPACPIKA